MSAFGLAIIVAKQAEIQLSLAYIGVHRVPGKSRVTVTTFFMNNVIVVKLDRLGASIRNVHNGLPFIAQVTSSVYP